MKRMLARVRRAMSKKFGRSEALRRWEARDFSDTDFRNADFKRADFRNVNFRGANFRNADFSDTDFRNADFRWADFPCADFRGANFRNTNFRNTDFRNADFKWADFRNADFSGADFLESSGVQWASCGWIGHDERGQMLLALKLPQGIRYFCRSFNGDESALSTHIHNSSQDLAPSHWRALEFCKASML